MRVTEGLQRNQSSSFVTLDPEAFYRDPQGTGYSGCAHDDRGRRVMSIPDASDYENLVSQARGTFRRGYRDYGEVI